MSLLARVSGLSFAFLLSGLMTAGGCSRQGVGERCDKQANGDEDCEDGLTCKNISTNVDRCCPESGGGPKCVRAETGSAGGGPNGGAPSDGEGGAPGSGATAGASSTPSAGAPNGGQGGDR